MKKFKNMNFAYGAVALLIGAMTFSACSSDEEVVNVNPSFDGESVKTQFAINIPRAAQTKTRMTGGNTQADGTGFLGMKDIRLYPFTLASGTTEPTSIASVITLAPLAKNDIYGKEDNSPSSKIYSDVTIPVGTNHFLFYGQAAIENATGFANGNLTTTFTDATSVSAITFALEDVLLPGTVPSNNEQAVALLNVLNGVESVEGWGASADDSQLKKLYDDFVKMKAGSASSIKAALESLYNAASKLKTADDDVAAKIMAAITNGSTFTVSGGDATSGYTLSITYTFPRNINLPDGAVAVCFNSTANAGKKFSYVSGNNQVIGSNDNIINVANVTYPASLYYYANTPLKASDNSVANWPTTTLNWSDGFKDWGDVVLATTRSIAMKDNINYGVGNLALAVRTYSNTLTDNGEYGTQRTVTVGDETFPITAILIGGQPAKVDYAFAPIAETTFTKTIYDKVEDGKYAKYVDNPNTCNYTLALPNIKTNFSDDESKADKVQFAIELQNNSDIEFVGHEGQIIYKGSKFYLLGSLDPGASDGSVTKPEGDDKVKNVFESDYKTTAKVTIKSLKEAYNVIPDLRATNLEFGLSVDLEWKKGITFDVEIK